MQALRGTVGECSGVRPGSSERCAATACIPKGLRVHFSHSSIAPGGNGVKISFTALSLIAGNLLLIQPALPATITGNLQFGTTLLGTWTLVDELKSSSLAIVGLVVVTIPVGGAEYATVNAGVNWEHKLVFPFAI